MLSIPTDKCTPRTGGALLILARRIRTKTENSGNSGNISVRNLTNIVSSLGAAHRLVGKSPANPLLLDDRLLKQALLSKLDPPDKGDLTFFREWLGRPTMRCFPICGLDLGAWDENDSEDLIALKSTGSKDLVTQWVTHTLVPLYHRFLGEKLKG